MNFPTQRNIYLFGPNHAINAKDDKRNAEDLSHIEWERSFEGFLDLLRVLDEEAESEDIRQAETEIPACTDLFRHLLMQCPHDKEE